MTKATPRPHRILVVDDEENIALTLQLGLRRVKNCEVVTTSSSQQALAYFEEQTFDLLITDYMMPELDGMGLVTQIRRRYPETPVIMITAYHNDRLEEQASSIPIQCILDKPVELKTVRTAVSRILANQQSLSNPMAKAG
ncbi:MAG: response regulator [Anaerolineae bacterium]|nr:response regulator [Anaerolineae bacterium]